MGLDMYVYKITKFTDEEVDAVSKMTYDEIIEKFKLDNFGTFVKYTSCEYIHLMPEYAELLPFLSKIRIPCRYIDLRKIKEDYKIPEDLFKTDCDKITEDNKTYIVFHFEDFDYTRNIDVKIPEDIFHESYTFEEYTDFYFWKTTEIQYWRKNYELRDILHNRCIKSDVENCGWYRVTDEMIVEMKKHNAFEEGVPVVDHTTSELFYHPWW